jgi:kumamolisin
VLGASSHRGSAFVPVSGSDRSALPGATRLGSVEPDASVAVTVLVRRREDARPFDAAALASSPAGGRSLWARGDAFAAARGASPEDIARIEQFATSYRLIVLEASRPSRTVRLQGRAEDACAAFNVDLGRYRHPEGDFRGRTGLVSVPQELGPIVAGVFGLDNRPQARPQFRIADPASVTAAYAPNEVAALYRFPTDVTGQGGCVALIELGGGYRQADLDTYFRRLDLPSPTVIAVPVDGAANAPTGDPNGPDGEVMLDIEIVGAIAPGARIAVYFAPNTDQGFIDAVTTAVHDQTNRPAVISISWGSSENAWTSQAQDALDQAFSDAAALGITVCVAAGDDGATDGVADGRAHVSFPASSPHSLACGGTRLEQTGSGTIAETVWNSGGGATGGGVSDTFSLPSWQTASKVPPSINPDRRVGRGLPDIAADADPTTGYQTQVDNEQVTVGGTSAAAPLWAALITLLNEKLGTPLGYLNPRLYAVPAGQNALNDITGGNNALDGGPGYDAGPGWDACTGLGTPNGQALLQALTG